MSELILHTPVQTAMKNGALSSEDDFVCAFNQIRTELVSTLYYMLGNHEDALDAAQDAFLKCWRTRANMHEIRNMRAWIFRVGLNAAKDLQRNAWRRRAKPFQDHAGPEAITETTNPTATLEEQEALQQLHNALGDLRSEEREIFLLRQNGSLTYEEIAELRRCPVGTVKTQMRSAVHKLRLVLQETELP